MAVVIHKLYGMRPELESKLRAFGIRDSDDLLRVARLPNGIVELARATGIEPHVITALAQRADLARIRGIGEIYMMLLEAAGVGNMHDLAKASPETLREQLAHINGERQLVGRVPALAMVNGWVNKAQRLPKILEGI